MAIALQPKFPIPDRTSQPVRSMKDEDGMIDIGWCEGVLSDVRFGPCVDGSGLARRIFTLQHWSEQPCVRPVCAVLMTAGHNALRGSGPGQKAAF